MIGRQICGAANLTPYGRNNTSNEEGGICPESPDGVECVGKWEEALDDGPAAGVMPLNPKLTVVAASAQSNTV